MIKESDDLENCTFEAKSICLSKIIDNSVPMMLILIEFSYNAVPFCRRHLIFIIIIAILYLITNFTITKYLGQPVYQILDWNSTLGYIMPFAFIAYVVIVFLIVEWINSKKLIRNNLEHIVNITKGKVGSK